MLFLDECLQQLEGKGIVYAGRRRETQEIASHSKEAWAPCRFLSRWTRRC